MEMLGRCKTLKVYLDEKHRWEGKVLHHVLVERMLNEGMAGATVTRAIEGFGSSTRIHSARWLDAADSLPVVLEVVDRPEKVDAVLAWLPALLPQHCLVTVGEVEVLHYYAQDGRHHPKT